MKKICDAKGRQIGTTTGNLFASILLVLNKCIDSKLAILLFGIRVHRKTSTRTFKTALFVIAPNQTQHKYPSTLKCIHCAIVTQWNTMQEFKLRNFNYPQRE